MQTTQATVVPDDARFVTIEQLARARQCSEETIRRGIRDGSIPAVRFGRLVRIPRAVLTGETCGAGQAVRAGKVVEVRG